MTILLTLKILKMKNCKELLLIATLITTTAFAQINIKEIPTTATSQQNREVYDGKSDIQDSLALAREKNTLYKYVGYNIFIPMRELGEITGENYSGGGAEVVCTKRLVKVPIDKYLRYDNLNNPEQKVPLLKENALWDKRYYNKSYKIVDIGSVNAHRYLYEFKVLDDNNDTLYFATQAKSGSYIFEPYYNYLSQKYNNQTVVLTYVADWYKQNLTDDYKLNKFINSENNLIDVSTHKLVNSIPNSLWNAEIAVMTPDSGEHYYIYYVLKNEAGETLALRNINSNSHFGFALQSEVTEAQQSEKRKQAETQKEVQANKQKTEQYKQSLIAKYGSTNGTLIANGKLAIGMTKDMIKEAWGTPIRITTNTNQGAQTDVWYYGTKTYTMFINGILKEIHEDSFSSY